MHLPLQGASELVEAGLRLLAPGSMLGSSQYDDNQLLRCTDTGVQACFDKQDQVLLALLQHAQLRSLLLAARI